ncbi:hypothetical protein UlMin_026373 [Ulmus minor]
MGVFAVDTLDLADIEWSPDDSDSPLDYKMDLFKYHAYESGQGVKSISWSPCGHFLTVGSYDQMLLVLNHLTWKTFAEFVHLSSVRGSCCAAVFKEVDEPLQLDMSELCLNDDFIQGNNEDSSKGHFGVRYDVTEVPVNLPFQKPLADKPNPKQGICMPSVLWIWDICRLELTAILVQKDPIQVAIWDLTCTRLVLCIGSSHFIPLPQFNISDLKWNSDGSCLLLKDKGSF